MIKLENWNEITNGLYRYVISAGSKETTYTIIVED